MTLQVAYLIFCFGWFFVILPMLGESNYKATSGGSCSYWNAFITGAKIFFILSGIILGIAFFVLAITEILASFFQGIL